MYFEQWRLPGEYGGAQSIPDVMTTVALARALGISQIACSSKGHCLISNREGLGTKILKIPELGVNLASFH